MHIAPFILIVILTFHSTSLWGQKDSKLIEEIRKEFKLINSDTTLSSISLNNEEYLERMTDGGGHLTGYFKNGRIVKIVDWVGLSSGFKIVEFYYSNSKLIFVYKEFHSFIYDEAISGFRYDTTEKSFTGRYYFLDEKLIEYIAIGKNRFENNSLSPNQELLIESEKHKTAILKKRNNIR